MSDSCDYSRSARTIQGIEHDFGLIPGALTPKESLGLKKRQPPSPVFQRAHRTDQTPEKVELQALVDSAIEESQGDPEEFLVLLAVQGVSVWKNEKENGYVCLSYCLEGYRVNAAHLGNDYTYSEIEKRLAAVLEQGEYLGGEDGEIEGNEQRSLAEGAGGDRKTKGDTSPDGADEGGHGQNAGTSSVSNPINGAVDNYEDQGDNGLASCPCVPVEKNGIGQSKAEVDEKSCPKDRNADVEPYSGVAETASGAYQVDEGNELNSDEIESRGETSGETCAGSASITQEAEWAESADKELVGQESYVDYIGDICGGGHDNYRLGLSDGGKSQDASFCVDGHVQLDDAVDVNKLTLEDLEVVEADSYSDQEDYYYFDQDDVPDPDLPYEGWPEGAADEPGEHEGE